MNALSYRNSYSSFESTDTQNTTEPSRTKFERIVGAIPEDQRHILYIDRSEWEAKYPFPKVNPYLFDNEPGYHDAMEKVLNFIGDNLGEKLDALKLRDLHDMCVDGVFSDCGKTEPFAKGYCPRWKYGFDIGDVPQGTLDELENEYILIVSNAKALPCQQILLESMRRNMDYLCTYYNDKDQDHPGEAIYSNFLDQLDEPKVHKIINAYFDRYYAVISSARSEDEILAAIARICRAINMFHVFPDGNGRTVLWALLPKLLMENDFCPAMLDNPNRFAAGYYSVKEMVEHLKKGMDNFQLARSQFSSMTNRISLIGS